MFTNKPSNLSRELENSITVTPIKMEIDVSPTSFEIPSYDRSTLHQNSVTKSSNAKRLNMDNKIYSSLSGNSSNSEAGFSLTSIKSSVNMKDKSLTATKSIKLLAPRKPPPTVENFWTNIMEEVRGTHMIDAKHQALPLARIKKIMKLDENAKMIAAEAPLLFAKACEFFIQELTMRAWIHTEESKRRTLQRSDIAQAIANYDQFDFLIDIVPREDIKPSGHHRKHDNGNSNNSGAVGNPSVLSNSSPTCTSQNTVTRGTTNEMLVMTTESLNTLATVASSQTATSCATNNNNSSNHCNQQQLQSQQQVLTASHTVPPAPQQIQIIQTGPHSQQAHLQYFIALPGHQQTIQPQLIHQLQLQQQLSTGIATPLTATSVNLLSQPAQQPQLILTAATPNLNNSGNVSAQHQATLLQGLAAQQQQHVQLLQQVVVAPTGEVANIPIAINTNQLNLLRLQMPQVQQQLSTGSQQTPHTIQQQSQNQSQIIIPTTQLITAQHLLQLQTQQNTSHHHHQQQQTATHTVPASASIATSASNVFNANQATTSQVNSTTNTSADRHLNNTYRSNC